MALRIEVSSTIPDARGIALRRFFNSLGLSTAVKDVRIIDAYTIDKKLSSTQARKAAELLTNPLTETSSPHARGRNIFDYAIEIRFLPGVTDNVGASAKETIADGLKLSFKDNEHVYSSKVLCITFNKNKKADRLPDIKRMAAALYNPLIQSAGTLSRAQYQKQNGFAPHVPKVKLAPLQAGLAKNRQTIAIDLNVPDEELAALGRLGILDPPSPARASAGKQTKQRRGPLALNVEQLKVIRDYFHKKKRLPTDVELESLAQTWSEHCKHTIFADPLDDIPEGIYRRYIKGATQRIRHRLGKKDFCVSVFSDNAGAIIFDDNYLVTHKVETHNTPSALDPFGGAITGIVGVNRDCLGFGLGAKPIINTYGFCVAPPDDASVLYRDEARKNPMLSARRIFAGVVEGINAGGNQSGIPTNDGFVYFDKRFRGKPLVFAGTVGLIPRKINKRKSHVKYAKPGDYIAVLGGRVGLDGIHGATFSSESLSKDSPASAVQIGDPITQKKLSDALIKEARSQELFSSITDCGAGGLSSAIGEMATATGGCKVALDKVPVKYPGLAPWQIWISESQERMVVAVPPKKWRTLQSLMQARGVEADVIGSFTNSKRCIATYKNKTVMDIDLKFLHDGRPVQQQISQKPAPMTLPDNKSISSRNVILNLKSEILNLLSLPNLASYAFISGQYDHEVQGGSVTKPLQGKGRVNSEATVTKPLPASSKGIVLAHGLYPDYSDIDTYRMAAASIDSAIRAAVCAGAPLDHLAILDNFCWYSGNEPESLYKLKRATQACFDIATAYHTPFISGKDSMYNDFKGFDANGQPIKISIPPTLLISAIGVMPDVTRAVTIDAKLPGDFIYLLGETHDELGASEYASMNSEFRILNSELNVPALDTKKNYELYQALERAIAQGLVASAISVSRGGLAATLMKTLIAGQLGASINIGIVELGTCEDPLRILFSESQGRIVVTVNPKKAFRFETIMKKHFYARIGTTSENSAITIADGSKKIADLTVREATEAYRATFKNW